MNSFRVGDRIIGENAPVFVIAEAGVNHAGLFIEAQKMVEVASNSKADAVTFQHIASEEINSNNGKKNEWDKWRFTDEQIRELFNQAHSLGLATTACVVDFDALEFVVEAGADFLKVVSGDITCHPFLAECARTGLPIFLSTGSALLPEIEAALEVIEKSGGTKVVVYQTNSKYPTPPNEVDLRAMEVLKSCKYPVGFCDHTKGTAIALAAVALGARVIEKHFSLDCSLPRPDYTVSINPDELIRFVSEIRIIEQAIGQPIKRRYPSEEEQFIKARRSVVARNDIVTGTILQWKDLAYKRPGTGIQPSEAEKFVGKTVLYNVKKDQQLSEDIVKGEIITLDKTANKKLRKPKITIVVICRLKSTRLPKKALRPINGLPSIERCLLNCLAVPNINQVVLATSDLPQNDPLDEFTIDGKVKVIRGDPDNVAKRMVQAANATDADIVLRVTGDSPAVSPEVLSFLINSHLKSGKDFTTPTHNYAMGTGADVYTVESLYRLLKQSKPLTHTEYLSFYYINNPNLFSINMVELPDEFRYPEWRLTLDEPKDLEMFEILYSSLNVGREPLFFSQIREYLIENPEVSKINADVSIKWLDNQSMIKEINEATVLDDNY